MTDTAPRPATSGKVPAATAGFWVGKILATTLGEVGGNLISQNMGWAISKRR